jgi:S1-C subfamily serine protease
VSSPRRPERGIDPLWLDDDDPPAPDEEPLDSAPAPDRRRRTTVVAVVAAALVLTAYLFYHWRAAATPASLPTPRPSASATPTRPPTTAEIFTALAPSVVSIDTVRKGPAADEVTGTGVIVNADATILTALHVVNNAARITVTYIDGTKSAAAVLSADPTTDIAMLAPATLPSLVVPAVLGNSGRLAVGDGVVAIGDQLGLTRTTTTGVVSGLNRVVAPGPEGHDLTGLIQFDAAVNPGSSGGPLLNSRGETVGIVVALANPTKSDTFIGIGFAVPIGSAVTAGGGDRVPLQ